MSHLLAISVGPVQDFIAAARRTRDLWFGSYVLSEISRAAAKEVEQQGGTLIFPSSSDADKVENVSNVILAELDAADPQEVAAKAKNAAQTCWLQFAGEALREASAVVRMEIWEDQVHDVIEFYAAWVARSNDYHADRLRVMRLLAGRKNCRDFKQPKFDDAGLPKSSLDGQRPTVLGPKRGESRASYRDKWPENVRRKLRLSAGEQLDVVGLAKRCGKRRGEGDPHYPSVARVAAETWLRGIEKAGGLQPLKDACQTLAAKGLNVPREETYRYFPYEGTIIYRDRHADLKFELRLEDHDLDAVAAALGELGGEPSPYLAVLVADGDKMGDALSRMKSAHEHRSFSLSLARFAATIVKEHNGVLIYAGGDDVLAFVPVDTCLNCARSLHDSFADLPSEHGSLTLSVGVAIGHFMESLEDLLEYGRAAEKDAKGVEGKDALAVHLRKRGGAPIRLRAKWTDGPDERIMGYARLMLAGAIPSKLPYDLRKLADIYKNWPPKTVATALRQDVARLIRDKQPRSGRQYMAQIEETLLTRLTDGSSLRRFAEELLVARQIAAALKQIAGPLAPRPTKATRKRVPPPAPVMEAVL
jgi:CRISPR-associated protein Cmr2